MPDQKRPNRSVEFRARAHELRLKAETATDPKTRQTLLQTADTWEQMAAYEDKRNPPRPSS